VIEVEHVDVDKVEDAVEAVVNVDVDKIDVEVAIVAMVKMEKKNIILNLSCKFLFHSYLIAHRIFSTISLNCHFHVNICLFC